MVHKRVIEMPLKFLSIVGLNQYTNNTESKLRTLVSIISQIYICTNFVLQIILGDNWDRAAQNLAAFCAVYQGIFKTMGMRILHKIFVELLYATEEFWPINRFGDKAAETSKQFHQKNFKLLKVYSIIFGLNLFIYIFPSLVFKPFINTGRELPTEWYDVGSLNNTWYYASMYSYHVRAPIIMWSTVAEFDGLFFSTVPLAYCEVEKIKYGLLNHIKDNYRQFESIVRQHNVVLVFVEMVNNTFSLLFLNQIVTSFGMLCMAIYFLTEHGDDVNILIQWVPYAVNVSGQIFIYCLIGNILSDQMESVVDVAYDVDWYNWEGMKQRKSLILIMARARRRDEIIVGRILTLNLDLFVSIMQKAFFMYTFLQTMKSVE